MSTADCESRAYKYSAEACSKALEIETHRKAQDANVRQRERDEARRKAMEVEARENEARRRALELEARREARKDKAFRKAMEAEARREAQAAEVRQREHDAEVHREELGAEAHRTVKDAEAHREALETEPLHSTHDPDASHQKEFDKSSRKALQVDACRQNIEQDARDKALQNKALKREHEADFEGQRTRANHDSDKPPPIESSLGELVAFKGIGTPVLSQAEAASNGPEDKLDNQCGTSGVLVKGSTLGTPPLFFKEEPPGWVPFLNSTGAVVPCSAGGSPPPTVTWRKADSGAPVTELPGLRQLRPDGSLVFPPFGVDQYRPDVHATSYRCEASNSFGIIGSRDVRVTAGT
nr:translation initiation factor IF-2-like [Rhipicephalus microplus]